MQTVSVNGIEMAYRDEGSGAPLLLVHAFPFTGAMWQPQLAALSTRFRLIIPDLRGFGASQLGLGAADLDQYADDLVALLDHLGVARCAVGGLSMGGYITFALLRRLRERVSALILADTRSSPDSEQARQGREANARLVQEQGPGAIADQMLPKLLAPSTPDGQRAIVRGLIEANTAPGMAAALWAMARRPDSTPLLAEIGIPTLIIVGAEDILTPPSDAQAMHAAIRGSRLVEIPGVGHLSNLEAPEAFNTALEEFLVGLD